MKTFNPAQLAEFLSLLDQELRAPEHLIVIGGAAAALHYGARRNTSDIDTFNALSLAVEKGVRAVQQRSRLGITVSRAAIAAPPGTSRIASRQWGISG